MFQYLLQRPILKPLAERHLPNSCYTAPAMLPQRPSATSTI